jgi:flagellar biosynthesis protein FlhG
MHVLAGGVADSEGAVGRRHIDRLLRQMHSLAPHTDWFIVDAGHRPDEMTARLWAAAEQILLVTSRDAAAVMDTYALVKTLLSRQPLSRGLALVVNQAAPEAAADVCGRIDKSCRRFLGMSVQLAGWVPRDAGAASQELSAAIQGVSTPLDDAIGRLAQTIIEASPPATFSRIAA